MIKSLLQKTSEFLLHYVTDPKVMVRRLKTEESFVPISNLVRFVSFGLDMSCKIEFSGRMTERIFHDSIEDQVSAKFYELFDSDILSIQVYVDEYEPEQIRLRVVSSRTPPVPLAQIVERAEYHVFRIRKSKDSD